MGIWHPRQATSLRGNRFYRCPERSHCVGLSFFRQRTLSWTLQPTIQEWRTFFGNPDCVSWRKISNTRTSGFCRFLVDCRLFGSWNNIYFEFCVRIVCQKAEGYTDSGNCRSDLRPIRLLLARKSGWLRTVSVTRSDLVFLQPITDELHHDRPPAGVGVGFRVVT